jgi:hypothetical protein
MSFRIFTLTAKTFAAGTFDKGVYTNGEETQFSFGGGVQQPTADDLELLDEGKRARRTIVVFSCVQLNLSTKAKNADQVLWEGEWYEVNVTKPFRTEFPGNYKAICTKIENPDDVPVAA